METSVQVFRGDSRNMAEIPEESIDLVVTSPPYWQIKDYGTEEQLGFGQSLHEYLYDLCRVWQECFRTLQPGRKLCINIGDQFARAAIYGRYKVIPIHSEITLQCESLGFDFLGSIIWQKKTTINATGGAAIMGSFPHPPNGVVELDYEHILLFKKPGTGIKPTEEQKRRSELSKEDWKLYFSGHWNFGGARQGAHEAMFPEELPKRLIRMFSFAGDTVLDPFLGSGTTAKVAMDLGRSAIGYEINPKYIPMVRERLGEGSLISYPAVFRDQKPVHPVEVQSHYRPQVQNAMPIRDAQDFEATRETLHRVIEVVNETTLRLDSGEEVSLLGVRVPESLLAKARTYLQEFVLNKHISIRYDDNFQYKDPGMPQPAYIYLKNKIFINKKMIEMGVALAERHTEHKFKTMFITLECCPNLWPQKEWPSSMASKQR